MRRAPLALALVLAGIAGDTSADRHPSLDDYRYFRRLSIDLAGHPPTRDDLTRFERGDFELGAWIDQQLASPAYAERVERIYMDRLRLELGSSYHFAPPSTVLRRDQVNGPDGRTVFVYYRQGQRRKDRATDRAFCLPSGGTVTAAQLDARTVVVEPWWLYADYAAAEPRDRVDPSWATRFPGYELVPELLVDADGTTPTTAVRVCREEAQTAATAAGASCLTATGFERSAACGCGPGLERCLPSPASHPGAPAFVIATAAPLGLGQPFEAGHRAAAFWERMWWSEEARHLLDDVFGADRDVRELLVGRDAPVNGPLAQFYRALAGSTCCGPAARLGYTSPEPLVELPASTTLPPPQATTTWLRVDRGPRAAGLLTLPIFLAKYATRRARAHAAYSVFACRDFIAAGVAEPPSTEPDLAKRPGCATCHATLEPLAAYFTRVRESDWTYLPPATFPARLPRCAKPGKPPGECRGTYDPDFHLLAGAHAAPDHAEAGPRGLAAELVASPDFAPCAVQTVAEALLGRPLGAGDEPWKRELATGFVAGGYRMRAVVRAIVSSSRYRASDRPPLDENP
ncbi:MAG TPA: DUF1549 domain-containing protein [Kofleriaceae bacterium]|jgi:hypothetical protein